MKLKYTWQLTPDGRLPTGSTNSITTVVEVAWQLTFDSRLPTGSTNSITMVVEVALGKGHA